MSFQDLHAYSNYSIHFLSTEQSPVLVYKVQYILKEVGFYPPCFFRIALIPDNNFKIL